jgi:hypothetical protein
VERDLSTAMFAVNSITFMRFLQVLGYISAKKLTVDTRCQPTTGQHAAMPVYVLQEGNSHVAMFICCCDDYLCRQVVAYKHSLYRYTVPR